MMRGFQKERSMDFPREILSSSPKDFERWMVVMKRKGQMMAPMK